MPVLYRSGVKRESKRSVQRESSLKLYRGGNARPALLLSGQEVRLTFQASRDVSV